VKFYLPGELALPGSNFTKTENKLAAIFIDVRPAFSGLFQSRLQPRAEQVGPSPEKHYSPSTRGH